MDLGYLQLGSLKSRMVRSEVYPLVSSSLYTNMTANFLGIQPTSGHYRPPASNFRDFIRSLKSRKVDLSHINVPKSYAILYGVEGYGRMKQKKKKVAEELHNITHPGERKKKEEKGKDQSESAQKEREMLERQREEKRDSLGGRLGERMSKVMSLGKG